MIRPFRFEHLPKVDREQAALHESLCAYISQKPFRPGFRDALAAVLSKYLKGEAKVMPPEVHFVGVAELPSLCPKVACILVLNAGPEGHKILVELDGGFAALAVERLLGGSGNQGRLLRPLTDIEEGVLSFLVLRLLREFANGFESGYELPLTLDGFASNLNAVSEHLDAAGSYHMLTSRFSLGKRLGYARILIPPQLVEVLKGPGQSGGNEIDYARVRRRLQSLGEVAVDAAVELARVELAEEDIANLEVGDIIVLDNHQLSKGEVGFQGSAFIRLGAGQNGGLEGQIADSEDVYRFHVTSIVVQEEPPAQDAGEAVGEAEAADAVPADDAVQVDESEATEAPIEAEPEA